MLVIVQTRNGQFKKKIHSNQFINITPIDTNIEYMQPFVELIGDNGQQPRAMYVSDAELIKQVASWPSLDLYVTHLSLSLFLSLAQLARAAEYTDYISADSPNECPVYDTKQTDGESTVMLELWGNTEYPFIAITPRSTLARSGSTW